MKVFTIIGNAIALSAGAALGLVVVGIVVLLLQ